MWRGIASDDKSVELRALAERVDAYEHPTRDPLFDDRAIDLPEVAGNGDPFDQDHNMVVDWKFTGTTAIDKLLAAKRAGKPPKEQVSQEYRVQAHLYGMGHANKGRLVDHVRLVFLARHANYDRSAEWTETYDERIALWAVSRYYDVVAQVAELDLGQHPGQVVHVPFTATNDACHWCPFHRPGQPSDFAGCRGHESDNTRPTTDWLASLPSSSATPALVR